jgi:hypothetical protein
MGEMVIIALWAYSTSLWKFQNSIVYGASKEAKLKELDLLWQQMSKDFLLYAKEPHCVVSP